MKLQTLKTLSRFALVATVAATLSACNMVSRLATVGDGPDTTPIMNPTKRPDYRPVSMPMPAPQMAHHNPNSLWRSGARAFFKDQRAKEVGDILTVSIALDNKGKLANSTERKRKDAEDTDVTNLLGLEAEATKILPQAANMGSLISFGNAHSTQGDGEIDRSEEIELEVAAVITQILPNGNLVIAGRQEVRVNYELRELKVTGIVRREDISTSNTVSHDKIAEMRLAYGGRGTISDLQQPRWGTQIWDILFPF